MFMLSLKSICSPPFIVPFGTLQPDAAPADLRSDVDVFCSLCGLRKLLLVATACAATMCHKKITSLCLFYHKQVILSIYSFSVLKSFPRIGAPLDSRPQALHLIRPVFRSDCWRAPSDFAAAALPVLLAIRFLLVLSTFVFACLFLFVSLGMLSMEHWCFSLSLQG